MYFFLIWYFIDRVNYFVYFFLFFSVIYSEFYDNKVYKSKFILGMYVCMKF